MSNLFPNIAGDEIFLHEGASCFTLRATGKFLTDEDIALFQN